MIEVYKNTKNINYIIFKTTKEVVNERGSVYEATRFAWRMSYERAQKYRYVLGVIDGVVRGVYEVESWRKIISGKDKGRIEFFGYSAPQSIAFDFLNKSVPTHLISGQNPVRYVFYDVE